MEEKVLVLRSCRPDMTSHDGFTWPESDEVVAPDWRPTAECGNGLHGWLWGVGDYSLKYKEPNAKWLVLEVEKESIIELDGKVKFPKCNIVFCGAFWPAFFMVRKSAPDNPAQGDYGVACVFGVNGMARAGEHGSIIVTYHDGNRLRHIVGYVGEDGIEAGTWYGVQDGKLQPVVDKCEVCGDFTGSTPEEAQGV